MPKDFHEKPFDEGTLLKLELFRLYAREWLPVFVSNEHATWPDQVNIVDFFAGKGTDSEGAPGSPLRFLDVVKAQVRSKWRANLEVNLLFSDADQGKVDHLRTLLALQDLEGVPVNIDVANEDFSARFKALKAKLSRSGSANLLIVDQFGVKEVPPEIFDQIIRLSSTDVLIFVSSNTFRRFGHLPEVKRLAMPAYQKPADYYKAHVAVAEAFREMIPKGITYYLGSFSIKKGSNVYGVLFGTRHPLGMDKFLSVAWKIDPIFGDANFDLHREGIDLDQNFLFEQMNVPTKLQVFEEELERAITEGRCRNELEIIRICHARGVLRQAASPVLARLKKGGRLSCDFKVPDINRRDCPRPISFS